MPLLPPAAPAEEVKARWVACPTSNAFGTGQLGAASSKKSVYIMDGSADVDVSYSLQATAVEAYKE